MPIILMVDEKRLVSVVYAIEVGFPPASVGSSGSLTMVQVFDGGFFTFWF